MNPGGWERALARAGRIAAAGRPPALCTDRHWDHVGIRGILAVVLQVLADQKARSVDEVPLQEVRDGCEQGAVHVRDLAVLLVGEELARSLDTDPTVSVPAGREHPVAMWLWLTRLWPPAVPDDIDGVPPYRAQRWDGMTRGIARNHPGAAVDLLTAWAADAAMAALDTG